MDLGKPPQRGVICDIYTVVYGGGDGIVFASIRTTLSRNIETVCILLFNQNVPYRGRVENVGASGANVFCFAQRELISLALAFDEALAACTASPC